MVRKSKLTPSLFLNMVFYSIDCDFKSLRRISVNASKEHSLNISKQAINERFSSSSEKFAKGLLKEAIASQVRTIINEDEMQFFKTVRIKDSTKFEIHESFASVFDGIGKGGGPNSKAGICIQYEFDVKNNNVLDLEIKSETQSDARDALAKKDTIVKGDLIIRDLGYYSDQIIADFIEKEAFFVSKLNHNVSVRLNAKDEMKLDFQQVYKQMLKEKKTHSDIPVYLGKKKQLVRLIMVHVPKEVYEKRILERNKMNKSRGYTTSEEYKIKARFNFYICNIPEQQCSWEVICKLYRVRWQIELAFKVWKSILHIDQTYKMKSERLVTTLYLKLLWIFINWQLISDCRNLFLRTKLGLLSLSKCFQTLTENSNILRNTLFKSINNLNETLKDFIKLLSHHHWIEKRNERCHFEELIEILFCNSSI